MTPDELEEAANDLVDMVPETEREQMLCSRLQDALLGLAVLWRRVDELEGDEVPVAHGRTARMVAR